MMLIGPDIPDITHRSSDPRVELNISAGTSGFFSPSCSSILTHNRMKISLTKQHQGGADGKGN
jgi:hypothetical protein